MSPPADDARRHWSSEFTFTLSLAAAAVGLGNLWRFPYMVGENGGAAFILAFLVMLVLLALPLMLLEVGAGRLHAGGTVATFRGAGGTAGRAYGWLVVLLTVVITSYYLVITGWTLGYAVQAVTFDVASFRDFTRGYGSVGYFVLVVALATLVLLKGLRAIERLALLLMPALLVLMVVLVGVASRLEGWDAARGFLLQADFARLREPGLWLLALGQAFYTLAIGQGYLVTYGSYLPRDMPVPRACLAVTGTEVAVSLLAGWMIFPFVFAFGFPPGEGSGLAFTTLPAVFAELKGGDWLALAFFVLFFAAAFGSSVAGLKVIVAAAEEELRLPPARAVLATTALLLLLGLPSALSYTPLRLQLGGLPVLDFLDKQVGTHVVIVSGAIGAALLAWRLSRARLHEGLGGGARIWPRLVQAVGRWLPLAVGGLLLWELAGA